MNFYDFFKRLSEEPLYLTYEHIIETFQKKYFSRVQFNQNFIKIVDE